MKRRDFVKTLSATGVALYASDLVGDLIAQSPKGRVMESRFKGLSDIALAEAKRLGCTYADIRFTRNVNDSVAVRDRIVTDSFGFGAGGMETSAGFGVRVTLLAVCTLSFNCSAAGFRLSACSYAVLLNNSACSENFFATSCFWISALIWSCTSASGFTTAGLIAVS